jgi:hypothetical protein
MRNSDLIKIILMIAESSFTLKSGDLGSSMFSRHGKATNHKFMCFTDNPEQETFHEQPEFDSEDEEILE